MNDFENKLRAQPFRALPPDLREALFGAPTHVIAPNRWTWRDWLWPSPQAWAALAAVWIVFAALSVRPAESAAPLRFASGPAFASGPTLLTFHHARDLDHAHELPT